MGSFYNIIKYPQREIWGILTQRPQLHKEEIISTVKDILTDVKARGERAVLDYEARFDHAELKSLRVTEEEIEQAWEKVSPNLRQAISDAHQNIANFHKSQRFISTEVETAPGITCWQKSVPIEKVGLYIPGGTAPLFSTVLMLATPAHIAGCSEIVLCTPPNSQSMVHPAILVAAKIANVKCIIKAGGAQAIAALAYGTDSVPKVYKIFGPGNRYVMVAKQLVSLEDTAIDMPAGPSEVCVIADKDADLSFVVADLLSQAEHGIDSQVMLITDSIDLLNGIEDETLRQLSRLERREMVKQSLINSHAILVHDMDEAIDLSNTYAPEHLIINARSYSDLAKRVVNAGSVFLGKYSCESAGDYASGTNHTLPTHAFARSYSGVNLDSFCRKITFQHINAQGVKSIGNIVELMASAENLQAHKNAMSLRIKDVEIACKQDSQEDTL